MTKIEIRKRAGVTGGREIWIDGDLWLLSFPRVAGRGRNYYTFRYLDGPSVMGPPGETAWIKTRLYCYALHQNGFVKAIDRLDQCVALAIGDGWIENPHVRRARKDDEISARNAREREQERMNECMRKALKFAHDAGTQAVQDTQMTAPGYADHWLSIRDGAAAAWEHIFNGKIEE